MPVQVRSSAARVKEFIWNLIGSTRESADLYQQHYDIERILDARLNLFEQQDNHIERYLNYLVRRLKIWVRHGAEETPEGELFRLPSPVLHIATRTGEIDPLGFGLHESYSERPVWDATSAGMLLC